MLEMVAPARFLEWLQLFVQSPVQEEPSRPSACPLRALLFCGLHFSETASRHSYPLSPLDVIVRSDRAWGRSKKSGRLSDDQTANRDNCCSASGRSKRMAIWFRCRLSVGDRHLTGCCVA